MTWRLLNHIKHRMQRWLGIPGLQGQINDLRKDFNDQMDMVGVDVHLRRGVQSRIIFVSHLGQQGEGTVKVVDAEFRDVGELVNFIKYCERSFENRVVIDAPPRLLEGTGIRGRR